MYKRKDEKENLQMLEGLDALRRWSHVCDFTSKIILKNKKNHRKAEKTLQRYFSKAKNNLIN